ncbi:acyltransferase [Candidatus Sumerlaeota bacterium]|nr:acyltransferase [Candidatus Sumerlaeota bacterium]
MKTNQLSRGNVEIKDAGKEKKRDDLIDILRFTGLTLIILAHTIPTKWVLFQLRNFDVPMMAVVSGMAFSLSSPQRIRLGSYYWKRILRLLLPTYVFLTVFFLVTALCFHLSGGAFPFKGKLLGTYALRNVRSIGYVWIIRVFLLIALTAPLLRFFWKRLRPMAFAAMLTFVYILYEVALKHVPKLEPGWLNTFVTIYVYYAVAYSVLFGFGMALIKLNGYQRLAFAIVFGIVFVLCVYLMNTGDAIKLRMQSFKYPPRVYYVSWGLFMSSLLSFIFVKGRLFGFWGGLIRFMSSASLWIYLWHIAVLSVINWHIDLFPALKGPWMKFATVIVISTLLTYLHRLLFSRLAEKISGVPFAAKFVSEAFLK